MIFGLEEISEFAIPRIYGGGVCYRKAAETPLLEQPVNLVVVFLTWSPSWISIPGSIPSIDLSFTFINLEVKLVDLKLFV